MISGLSSRNVGDAGPGSLEGSLDRGVAECGEKGSRIFYNLDLADEIHDQPECHMCTHKLVTKAIQLALSYSIVWR